MRLTYILLLLALLIVFLSETASASTSLIPSDRRLAETSETEKSKKKTTKKKKKKSSKKKKKRKRTKKKTKKTKKRKRTKKKTKKTKKKKRIRRNGKAIAEEIDIPTKISFEDWIKTKENQDKMLKETYEELLDQYNKLDLSEDQIIEYVKKVQSNKYLRRAGDMLIFPYLFCFWVLIGIQCVCCSIPCVWYRGCCCFQNCSKHDMKGSVDEETGLIYAKYKDVVKYGILQSNPIIIKEDFEAIPVVEPPKDMEAVAGIMNQSRETEGQQEEKSVIGRPLDSRESVDLPQNSETKIFLNESREADNKEQQIAIIEEEKLPLK